MKSLSAVRDCSYASGFISWSNGDFQRKVAPGWQLQVQLRWKLLTVAKLSLKGNHTVVSMGNWRVWWAGSYSTYLSSIHECKATKTDAGHGGAYWLNVSLSCIQCGMRVKEIYLGFRKWDFMKPNETMSKEEGKRCRVSPHQSVPWREDVGPTSVEGRDMQSSPVLLKNTLEGAWRMVP